MGDFTSTVRELHFATPRGSAPRPRRVLTYEEAVAQRPAYVTAGDAMTSSDDDRPEDIELDMLKPEARVMATEAERRRGDVVKAENRLDKRPYAIKRIKLDSRDPKLNSKIVREVMLLSRLHHENIVRYYQVTTITIFSPASVSPLR